MNLTEKLIYLRKKQGLTQVELAEKLDVSRQAISKWESGSTAPSIDNLKAVGKLYGVSMDYLLHDELEQCEVPQKETMMASNGRNCFFEKLNEHRILAVLLACFLLMVVCLSVKILNQSDGGGNIVPINNLEINDNHDDEYATYTFLLE